MHQQIKSTLQDARSKTFILGPLRTSFFRSTANDDITAGQLLIACHVCRIGRSDGPVHKCWCSTATAANGAQAEKPPRVTSARSTTFILGPLRASIFGSTANDDITAGPQLIACHVCRIGRSDGPVHKCWCSTATAANGAQAEKPSQRFDCATFGRHAGVVPG